MPRSHSQVATARARDARKNASVAEQIVWRFLRGGKTGFKFRREHQINDRFRFDFYCPEALLAVELDGEQHDASRDLKRDKAMSELGIYTYRIPNRSFFSLDAEPYRDHIAEIVRLCEERTGRKAHHPD